MHSERALQLFEGRSVRYWSKETDTTLTGGRKFLIREIDDAAMAGASVKSCRFVVLRSPGSRSRVGTIHVQSRTPHARPLPSVDIYGNSLGQTSHLPMIPQSFRPRALWRAPSAAACGLRDHPTPDLSQRESGSRSASEKSVQFGPDGAPFP